MIGYRLLFGFLVTTSIFVTWNIMNAHTQQKVMQSPQTREIFYYQNETLVQEVNPEFTKLTFLYAHPLGRLVRQILKFKMLSKVIGRYYDSPRSVRSIEKFIKQYNINMTDYEQKTYVSFNDFFARKLKSGVRVIDTNPNIITSPCDGKLFVIPNITSNATFYLKELPFNLDRFLGSATRAERYTGGTLMIFRLAPYDYHRFHFPIDCIATQVQSINGKLESVNPFVYKQGIQVLTENERHLIELQTMHHGPILMIPVGAFCVGKIIETYQPNQYVKKGDEAGYFMFGGSTVVLVIPPGKIKLEQRFIEHSAQGFETAVSMGQAIGSLQ